MPFHIFVGNLYACLGKMFIQVLFSFLNWVTQGFLLWSCMSSLYVFSINSSSDMWFANIFFHSAGLIFILLTVSLTGLKPFNLMWSHCLFCFCCLCFWCYIYKKLLLKPMSRSFFSMFSLKCFMISGLICMSLIFLC